jgi:hypothetical protein
MCSNRTSSIRAHDRAGCHDSNGGLFERKGCYDCSLRYIWCASRTRSTGAAYIAMKYAATLTTWTWTCAHVLHIMCANRTSSIGAHHGAGPHGSNGGLINN